MERHIAILKLLLETDYLTLEDLFDKTRLLYTGLKNPNKALSRDISYLIALKAVDYRKTESNQFHFFARLEWPTEITETEFFKRVKEMPKAKTYRFLS